MNLPTDDFILLSLVNTKLRDNYVSLSEFCEEEDVLREEVEDKLSALGYRYDEDKNSFVRK